MSIEAKTAVIIPAAGSGQRLGAKQPKALVPLRGRPLLAWTLEALAAAGPFLECVVLAPEGAESSIRAAIGEARSELAAQVQVVNGGATRGASVARGLAALDQDPALVVVHDAARPLVSSELLRRVLEAAQASGAATAARRPVDSMREDQDGGSRPIDRSRLWSVETPQAFRFELLRLAHERARQEGVEATDDASLVERFGTPIQVVEGRAANLKVTLRDDLVVAEALLSVAPSKA